MYNRYFRKKDLQATHSDVSAQATVTEDSVQSFPVQDSGQDNSEQYLVEIETRLARLSRQINKLKAERKELRSQIKPKTQIREAVIETILYDDPLFRLKMELDDLIEAELGSEDFKKRKNEFERRINTFRKILDYSSSDKFKSDALDWNNQEILTAVKKLNTQFEELNKKATHTDLNNINELIRKTNDLMIRFREIILSKMESKIGARRLKTIENDIDKMLEKKEEELQKYDVAIALHKEEIKKLKHQIKNSVHHHAPNIPTLTKSQKSKSVKSPVAVVENDSLSQHIETELKKESIQPLPPTKRDFYAQQAIKDKWTTAYNLYSKHGKMHERLQIQKPFQAAAESIIANQSTQAFHIKRNG